MDAPETLLEMKRCIAECEALVAYQVALLDDLARQGLDTDRAQALLAFFKDRLRLMREDLIREQERAAGNQR